jgi:hypothetical protein
MRVVWWSAGVSSTIAAALVPDAQMIYIEIDDHHPDNERFAAEVEQWLGRKILRIRHPRFRSVEDVLRSGVYVNGPSGAACTGKLKRQVRKWWEAENPGAHTYIWGYDAAEQKRADRIVETVTDHFHEFPLIAAKMTKEAAHFMLERVGIKRPAMYDLGYPNNNCIGCVKGWISYWNKIRVDFPEVFKRRAETERICGHSCITGIFLDELDPDRGRELKPVVPDCGILCGLMNGENHDG